MLCGDLAKLVGLCDVLYNFRVKYLCPVPLPKSDCFNGCHALFILFVFIYAQHISTSDDDPAFNSNTTNIASEAVLLLLLNNHLLQQFEDYVIELRCAKEGDQKKKTI